MLQFLMFEDEVLDSILVLLSCLLEPSFVFFVLAHEFLDVNVFVLEREFQASTNTSKLFFEYPVLLQKITMFVFDNF